MGICENLRHRLSDDEQTGGPTQREPGFTVVIPFYNEAGFIEDTLHSLIAQHYQPARILLIDNASTDDSVEICRDIAAGHSHIKIDIVEEPRPGKTHALARACAMITTQYAAFCDADTYYPPHYLQLARHLFELNRLTVAAVLAIGIRAQPASSAGRFVRRKGAIVGKFLAKQCHTGGFGQIFSTEALIAAGGYSFERWPYVLEDHEITYRVRKHGAFVYHAGLWCRPSPRRRDRAGVSWSFMERLVYHVTPFALKDWFFYRFLGPRLLQRGLMNARLRQQPWTATALDHQYRRLPQIVMQQSPSIEDCDGRLRQTY